MAEPLTDVDLDALAPAPKRVKLGGKWYQLPGDMPLELFLRIQAFEQRIAEGASETALLSELRDEVLSLFQVHQPALKALPKETGVLILLQALGAIYGGAVGEAPPNRQARRQKKRTPSGTTPKRAARATSR